MDRTPAGLAAELVFDGAYLLALWALAVALVRRLPQVPRPSRWPARPLVGAFVLLAVGDSAHVGLRLVALLAGDPSLALPLGDRRLPLIGFGALCTAITVTAFYVLLLLAQRRLSGRPWSPLQRSLLVVALVRMALLSFPQNAWGQVVPPQPWSLVRNLPLLALNLGVAVLYLRQEGASRRWQRSAGGLLLASAMLTLPVVLWIQQAPLLGLLMIPKSLAYLTVGLIFYRRLPSMAPVSSR